MEPKEPNLGRFPEQFRDEGVFAHRRVLVKIGDRVKALANTKSCEKLEGLELIIEDIIIEPRSESRGFQKRLRFKGIEGEYNPKNFEKLP